MCKLRRNTSTLPPLTPEGSDSAPRPDHYDSLASEATRLRAEAKQARQTLRAERKRAGSVEALLLRHIATLQEQVNDLRAVLHETPSAIGAKLTPSHNPAPKCGVGKC